MKFLAQRRVHHVGRKFHPRLRAKNPRSDVHSPAHLPLHTRTKAVAHDPTLNHVTLNHVTLNHAVLNHAVLNRATTVRRHHHSLRPVAQPELHRKRLRQRLLLAPMSSAAPHASSLTRTRSLAASRPEEGRGGQWAARQD